MEANGSAPRVSIVVNGYRRSARNTVREAPFELVRKAMRSLAAQQAGETRFEVILVHSLAEQEIDLLAGDCSALPRDRVIFHRIPPEGPTAARHAGASVARGEFVGFLDADYYVAPKWIAAALAAFEDEVTIVEGRTLPDPGRRLSVFTRYVRQEAENFYYETSNIFYRRAAFEEAGGFGAASAARKEWRRRAEAVLLAWRMKRKGGRSAFAADALAWSEVTRLSLFHWLVDNSLYRLPWLLRRAPELRDFYFGRYFFDTAQACLTLALAGAWLGWPSHYAALAVLPYAALRMFEPTQALAGARRPARPLVYLPRDLISFVLLLAGSLRYGAVLL